MCVRVHVQFVWGYVCVKAHARMLKCLWRPEDNFGCHSSGTARLFFLYIYIMFIVEGRGGHALSTMLEWRSEENF